MEAVQMTNFWTLFQTTAAVTVLSWLSKVRLNKSSFSREVVTRRFVLIVNPRHPIQDYAKLRKNLVHNSNLFKNLSMRLVGLLRGQANK